MAHRDVCQQHVIVGFGESDRCGGELSVLLWVFHHRDLHIQVSSTVVLGLHKHLLWGAHPQEVRSRHHIAEGSELTGQRLTSDTTTYFGLFWFTQENLCTIVWGLPTAAIPFIVTCRYSYPVT